MSRNPVEKVRLTGALSGCQDDIGVLTIETVREAIVGDDSYTKLIQFVFRGLDTQQIQTSGNFGMFVTGLVLIMGLFFLIVELSYL